MKAIVVSRYNENLDWLTDYQGYKIYVYNKSSIDVPGHIMLPNVGRESNTYLEHIVRHYHELSPLTIFLQGNPFDHCKSWDVECDWYTPLGIVRPHHGDEGSISHDAGLWPGAVNEDVCKTICEVINRPYTDLVTYPAGCQFIASKDCLQQHSLEVYQKLLKMSVEEPRFAWCFERLTTKMFGRIS